MPGGSSTAPLSWRWESSPVAELRNGSSYRPPPLLAGSLALHAAGALAFAVAPRHWRAIAGVLAADHLVLAAARWP